MTHKYISTAQYGEEAGIYIYSIIGSASINIRRHKKGIRVVLEKGKSVTSELKDIYIYVYGEERNADNIFAAQFLYETGDDRLFWPPYAPRINIFQPDDQDTGKRMSSFCFPKNKKKKINK